MIAPNQTHKVFTENLTYQKVNDLAKKLGARLTVSKRAKAQIYSEGLHLKVTSTNPIDRVTNSVVQNRITNTRNHLTSNNDVATFGTKGIKDEFIPKFIKNSKYYGKASVILKNKWARRGIQIGLSIAIFNITRSALDKITKPFQQPVIPEHYDKGYDIIRENMTDFGSPINLARATHKQINQYHSTSRKTTYTTVDTVKNNNLALRASKRAIRHTEY